MTTTNEKGKGGSQQTNTDKQTTQRESSIGRTPEKEELEPEDDDFETEDDEDTDDLSIEETGEGESQEDSGEQNSQ